MFVIIQILHVLVSITLILFILLQTGKGSDLGAMLGGGGANTLFGATGATTFLSKLTRYAAIIFMLTCLTLAYISAHPATAMDNGASVMPDAPAAADSQEAVPADSDDAAAAEEEEMDTEETAPAESETEAAEPSEEGSGEKEATGLSPKAETDAEAKDSPNPPEGEKTE